MAKTVYAARLKDKNQLHQSSSGGIFTAISDYFLQSGDYVMSSVYNYESQQLEFCIYDDAQTRDRARGSKYFQSMIGTAFRDAIDLLKTHPDQKLLFVGMGCQAEGFRKLCEACGVRERVFIADIICTGNPSPLIWKSFIEKFSKISYLTFKDKRNGWNHPTAVAVQNEEEVSLEPWLRIFYGHNADKPACYNCPFASTERKVDMTIGDFWRIENHHPDFAHPDGNSVVLIHTEKGNQLFSQVKESLDYLESDLNACYQKRLYEPVEKPVTRGFFWRAYRSGGIDAALRKYGRMPFWARKITKARHLLNAGAGRKGAYNKKAERQESEG